MVEFYEGYCQNDKDIFHRPNFLLSNYDPEFKNVTFGERTVQQWCLDRQNEISAQNEQSVEVEQDERPPVEPENLVEVIAEEASPVDRSRKKKHRTKGSKKSELGAEVIVSVEK